MICFVTSYPLSRQDLGGSGWVDRRLLPVFAGLADEVEVLCVTGPEGEWRERIDGVEVTARAAGDVPLELRSDRLSLARVAAGMLISPEPYLARKFTVFPGWRKAVELLRSRAAGRQVVTSGWPGLVLADAAGVPVAAHVAHNVESVIAEEHSPRPLRMLGEIPRLRRMERRLLALPDHVYALSRQDAADLHATALPIPLSPAGAPAGRTVGFIGKASWPPNARALEVLLGPVHDRLTAMGVHVDFVLAGKGTEQFAAHPRVVASGAVDDVADFYQQVGVAVVPRFGASTGVSVKVLEAAEFGVPSVLPRSLAEAIDPDGPWLVAETADEVAEAIRRWRSGEQAPDAVEWARKQDSARTAVLLRDVFV
ncbi:glycosyltransferase [Kutzneria sp. 744]|uniref:glycosyltransferase n=1 Tax=Kutzneria sp. (strain 744) TaxID=345341 RepID=UPI0003EEB64A|nr:glycosyltransferase [Kutzneria sp. 744]EWM15356.1 translation initiation factor IF-2 [Kutzneria sp. 744]